MKKPSLSVNFIMNAILTMSSFIFPLITFPYVSRVLLAEGNGKIQFANSLCSYFILLAQLGIPTYGVRTCAAERDNRIQLSRTVHELFLINTITTVISYALYFLTITYIPRFQGEKTLYVIFSVGIGLNLFGMEWMFRALEQYTYITVRSLVFKVISVVAMFLLIHEQSDYLIYAGITVFASLGSNLMNLTQLRKYIDCRPVGNYQIRRHLRPILVFFAVSCATTIYTSLDSVMLGFMATDADVGYYSASVKIKNILVSVIAALGTVVLPRVSYYVEKKQWDAFWYVVTKALRFVLLLSIPLTVYFMAFASSGVLLLSGDTYEKAIAPMVVIMPTLICIGLTSVLGTQIMVSTGREKMVLYSTIIGAVVDVIVNLLLIPSMQAVGAAIGTLIAEMAVLAYQYYVVRKEVSHIFRKLGIPFMFLASGIGFAASFWVHYLHLGHFLTLAISAVIFFPGYAVLLHIKKDPLLLEMESKVITMLKKYLKKQEQ